MKKRHAIGTFALLFIGATWIFNVSWRAAPPADPQITLISHRGVHQTFDRTGLENDTCTAERIFAPTHDLLENTIASMRAAFEAGAGVVELDVHPTTDGLFAVFHDWTLDCRTDGAGETRGHDMAYLKTLDIGHGYTPDQGATHPFRGSGIGLMPELREVFSALPDGRFLINFKSREAREGDMLAALLGERPDWRAQVWAAYGGEEPVRQAAREIEGLAVWSKRSMVRCLLAYAGSGWTGHVPEACRNTKIMIPVNVAPWLWGWPNLLQQRFRAAGSEVILLGPVDAGDPGTAGIDTLDQLARIPDSFSGYVWTNRIELIGPALSAR